MFVSLCNQSAVQLLQIKVFVHTAISQITFAIKASLNHFYFINSDCSATEIKLPSNQNVSNTNNQNYAATMIEDFLYICRMDPFSWQMGKWLERKVIVSVRFAMKPTML